MSQVAKVVEWVNQDGKPLWWRHAIRIALGYGEIKPEFIDVLYDLAKMEFGLLQKDEIYPSNALPVAVTGFGVEEHPINLLSLGMVQNVSSLAPDQTIELNSSGLTVIYGDNGAGKSSYAKILKSACLTRGDVPNILSNVFNPSDAKPQATLSFSSEGAEPTHFVWEKDGEDSPELKSIRIFDSKSAIHYISKEDSVEYKPAELKLLDELVSACLEVKRRLLGEQKQYEIPHPVLGYNPTTNAGKFISSLNSSTTTESVEVHCITDDELTTIEPLKREIHELTGKTPTQIRKELSNRLTYREPLLKQLITWSEQLGDESLALLGQLYVDRNTKVVAAEAIRQATLNGLPVDGIGGDAWKHMWKHVEGFISSQGNAFPPNDGEHCPTCLQTIDSTTAERMKLFHCYIQDKSQVEAQKAIQAFDSHKQIIGSISFDLSPHSGVLQEIQYRKPEIMTALGTLIGQLSSRQQGAIAETPSLTQPVLDLSVPKWLDAQLVVLKNKIEKVVDDGSLAKLLSDKHQEVLELEDKLKAKQQKQTISLEITRLKIIEKFSLALKSVVLTRVTNLSTTLSNEGGIGTLKAVFLQELTNLGYKGFDVATKTRGSDGGQKLKLVIPKLKFTATKIADVASEGEQKCIALAGFMAELTVDNRKSAIIFDDPVNSLDHKWRRLFAGRIAIEAQSRQVIVLTHDLPFLVMLKESTTQQPLCLKYIARRGDFSGYLIDKLPWDVMSTGNRTGSLRTMVTGLKRFCKNNPDCLEEDYNDKAKIIYGRFRDTLERLIEEWLLGGVVQRLGRNVQVAKIKDLQQWHKDDIDYVTNTYAKCCRCIDGHDTGTGFGVTPMPDVDELHNDIEEFVVFFGVVKKR